MKNTQSKKTKKFFEYKSKPLVRCGDVMYYGNMNDPYVVKIESKESKDVLDLKVSTSVNVEMIDTASNDNKDTKKIVKTSQKDGLYAALDIANIWLERVSQD